MRRRWLWWSLVAVLPIAALGSWLVRGARSGDASRTSVSARLDPRAAARDPQLRRVLELMQRPEDPKSWAALVELYGRLASDPNAVAARGVALNALFNEPAVALRLKRILDAIESDPTPPPQDPLWPELVHRLAEQWSQAMFDEGRDLMLMEKRGRARRALIASFAELADSEAGAAFSRDQAQALLTDLIDVYAQVDADQRPQIEEAVRKLGGNDPADLLAAGGLGKGKKLELQTAYERNLQDGINTLIKGQAAQPD